ncbi:MAG: hypothetical protein UX91_C0006G0195 [Candidatus Amesbacteria bacterium GW2011_GWB1_47_19]|nr:MAG: hypothetical protein UW51_C0002G0196 [Candidatus Amesbacteria bacterium GW2011_GWA1_44_24]KKU31213.1 MAG: hypothetical protein UX46_C0006G0005 [Candidatus Amesbacteria bacterium GW2011_GWC1_46_24]KKU67133.1 MAG: hypothetical protein UX91_C0006G0195 [Candidatus Amesbacteria bacterium GW2011_GWB1_47_19]OGD05489.1 MAG: hypothetical protein A2379_00835 [Candidatus Amesbacteria bacterium RIFOXYB1_FULL_47_13]HBC73003.1 hypothetical protein [Candidatus Amesbacteria bacterium]
MYEIIFDLETQKFFDDTGNSDPSQLRVSLVSVYRRHLDPDLKEISGQMFSYWENQLDAMWKLFTDADRIIGFNSLGFDVPVLKPYAPSYFSKLPHFDIYDRVKQVNGRAASLNSFAKDTLGKSKVDAPANAIKYWQAGDKKSLALLKKYCEADVILTRDVYDHGLHHHHLKFTDRWNTPRRVEVDFSYSVYDLRKSSKQSSLF